MFVNFYFFLTPFVFKSIVAPSLGKFPTCTVRSSTMPHYCHQVSYTKEAWARLMADPQDRLDIVRTPIEKLGGKLDSAFFAIAITEMPDNVSAAAIAIAFAAGGAVAHVQTTPLMTAAQAIEAMRKAATCGYKSVVAGHGAAAGA